MAAITKEALPTWGRARVSRLICLGVSIVAAAWLVAATVATVIYDPIAFGYDYRFYRDLGARWLADGTYYWPHQLAGPYDFSIMVDVLYPPPALLLFVPFAVLPFAVWWLVPAGVTLYALRRLRPAPWAVAVMLVLMGWHKAYGAWLYGSTDIWVMAGIFGGLLWGWPAVLVVLKPTLAPFALVGVKRRSSWVVAAVLGAFSLLMLPLWLDYVTAMRNLRLELTYSLISVPMMLVPLVAWFGRRRPASR